MRIITKIAAITTMALGLSATAASQSAEGWPNAPIRVVVPFPAGQPTDTLARSITASIAQQTGQSVVVENKPGANAAIGASFVARSKPDGYTLLFGSNSPMAGNMALFRKPGYDAVADLDAVALIAQAGWVLAVQRDAPYDNFEEFLRAAKEKTGGLSIGGGTTGYQMAANIVARNTGTEMVMVPYNGTPQLVTDVLGGHVDALVADIGTISQQVEAGTMKALVVLTPERLNILPDVPSLKELGYGEIGLKFSWMGMFSPKGTPQPVREKLAGLIENALKSDEVVRYLADQRMEPAFLRPDELAALQTEDIENYRRVMDILAMQPQ